MSRSAVPALRLKEGSASPTLGVALFLITKPNVVAAVALAGFAGMVLALGHPPDYATGGICITALSLAAAGSAMINNLLDSRIDLLMERVHQRSCALAALGTGRVFCLAAALITAAIFLSACYLTAASAWLILAAVLSYTVYYTLYLKRRSHWGALLGGIPGALPVLIGQAATTAAPNRATLLLFLVMLLWQPPHFWVLSLLCREEYRRAGIPVLPVVKGEAFTKRCITLGTATLIATPALLSVTGPSSGLFASVSLLLGGVFFGATYLLVRAERYRLAFSGSILYLLALLTAVIADLSLRLP